MFRAVVRHVNCTITTHPLATPEEANDLLDELVVLPQFSGGHLEEFIPEIGWVCSAPQAARANFGDC